MGYMDDFGSSTGLLLNGGGGGAGSIALDDSSFYDSGGFFDGGGDFYGSGAGDDFQYGYGFDQPVADQAILGDEIFYELPPPPDEIPFAPYEPVSLEPPIYEPLPESPFGGGNYFEDYLDYYLELGYDPLTAVDLAAQDASQQSIVSETTYEPLPLPQPGPTEFPYFPLPFDPFAFQPPEIPFTPEIPPPPPPPAKLGPCDTPTGLPGPCAGGTYHPTWDPCSCVPFPPAPPPPRQQTQQTSQQQQPRPPQQPQQPRPPQQPPCPTATHWVNPQTRRCEPKPKCPTGSVFDTRAGRCVLPSQLTEEPPPDGAAPDSKDNWLLWLLLAGGAVLVLGDGGSSGGRRRR